MISSSQCHQISEKINASRLNQTKTKFPFPLSIWTCAWTPFRLGDSDARLGLARKSSPVDFVSSKGTLTSLTSFATSLNGFEGPVRWI
ncbi:hypothetical protein M5D96_010746, partial [Drosophila gunungcola]